MTDRVTSTQGMIAGMTPELLDGEYVFVTYPDTPPPDLFGHAIATFKEAEGLSLIVPVEAAQAHNFDTDLKMRCITLNVYSSLEGLGLTAAVASALSEAGIACNMVAAYHHDHAFVPAEKADKAMQVLQALQDAASG